MRVLVWQWGRRGAGPHFAAALAAGFDSLPGVTGLLSLSTGAEILRQQDGPACQLAVPTYEGWRGLGARVLQTPTIVAFLARRLRHLRADMAVCAMPAPLDLQCVAALRRCHVPIAVVLHDAERHPGDGYPFQMILQRRLVRAADLVVALSAHVAEHLRSQRVMRPGTRLITGRHPPMGFGAAPPVLAHGGPPRLLFFGRLLPYKGLDLLNDAVGMLDSDCPLNLRVVGSGPESEALRALRSRRGVSVENRWVAESEIGGLLGWSDALVLPYVEASQSGVAAAALAAGRFVIATAVGGLKEQLQDEKLGILCEPKAGSLSAALSAFVTAPPPPAPPPDPAEGWRAQARLILEAMPRRGDRGGAV